MAINIEREHLSKNVIMMFDIVCSFNMKQVGVNFAYYIKCHNSKGINHK